MKTIALSIVLLSLLFARCNDKKIEITDEYIVNENWNNIAKAIKMAKMKLKKDSILQFPNISQEEILDNLEEDPSFVYYANVKTENQSFKGVKIYFNKDNGFNWTGEKSEETLRIIGKLEKNNWYKFSYLVTYPLHVYIYIDGTNKVHRFNVNLANY